MLVLALLVAIVTTDAPTPVAMDPWYKCPIEGPDTSGAPLQCKSNPRKSCMPEAQALAIAGSFARREAVDLSQYKQPVATYFCETKACEWHVAYSGATLAIGDHFVVVVNDATCESVIHGGL